MSAHEATAVGRTDPRLLRRTLGRFATGVTVLTYGVGGERRGATINSFTSVSMDPPLVLVSLARSAKAAAHLPEQPFVVNILGSAQLDVALHFAGRPQDGLAVPWADAGDVPRLRGTVAWLECKPWATYDGGDHVLVVGRVVRHDQRNGDPLLFHRGEFRMVGMALYELPRVVQLDGRPVAPWLGRAHHFHEVTEAGLDST